ncbi:MAG: cell division protein FtsX [Flavobacterium sp. BFFFF1]|uniref:cell division protein FtsX n=1 Tax=Flavobacterium sp. BFFFF1 TaxID=2015557 RepID=UPI000BCBC8F6|nr:permease-like cell division protein FtsX [Flavobacterium sp. BFFFF1]OYU81114.1 MAG: cell division protein FtsX [Flavobacterium sp. BFFFF1]
MSSSYEKFKKRRLITSYFSVVLSIFLVLFLLGILGLFFLNSKKLSDNFKEEIPMTVFFKNGANDSVMKAFAQELKTARFVKNSVFVPKEEAAKRESEDMGEDFMAFIGENPFENSFDIHLNSAYIRNDSIKKIEDRLKKNEMISTVNYDKVLVSLVNDNIEAASMWILYASIFLLIVAVLLINSSIRLSIYSNRFIIKTMQMVGATKSFIRKPFIWRSVLLGGIAAVLAVAALVASLFVIDENYPKLNIVQDQLMTGLVLLGVIVLGIFITWFSTFFATQRFLNLRTDDLY